MRAEWKRDDKDRAIVNFLIKNPGAAVGQVAEGLGYPPSTVQKRIGRMLDDKSLERIIRVLDWSAIGFPLHYWIDVKVRLYELRRTRTGGVSIDSPKKLAAYIMHELSKRYDQRMIIEDVYILLGSPADLSISIRAADHECVLEFVTNTLRGLGSIESTTTFHAAWSCADGEC
jgi:DNA-binding Lrp family transcriptional regulator